MQRVLVAYDGSNQSDAALEHALESFPDAELHVLTVLDPAEASYASTEELSAVADGWYEEATEEAERILDEARERAGDRDLVTEHVVGRPGRSVVEYAEDHDVDQVVTGSHGRTGVTRLLLGSVAETIVRRSPVPVTVVR
jgi:nucleotide-binding universal stress UspA family protein